MDKLAAYEMLLEDHPLWIKEAGISDKGTYGNYGRPTAAQYRAMMGRPAVRPSAVGVTGKVVAPVRKAPLGFLGGLRGPAKAVSRIFTRGRLG